MIILKNILTRVYENLTNISIPVAYGHFREDEVIEVPYIIFSCNKKPVSADSDIYCYTYSFNIELYYRGMDIDIEESFRNELYKIKKIVDYEQTILDKYILLRATFEIIEGELN